MAEAEQLIRGRLEGMLNGSVQQRPAKVAAAG